MTVAKLQLVNGEGTVSGICSFLIWWKRSSYFYKLQNSDIFSSLFPYSHPHTHNGKVILSVLSGGEGKGLCHSFLVPTLYWNQSFSEHYVCVKIRVGLNMKCVHFAIHCTITMACVHGLASQACIYLVLIPLPLYPSHHPVVLGYLKSLFS
jgi:hypothetical protein